MPEKHALCVFTKAPRPQFTKTRMTTAQGGILSDHEAVQMYLATLFDVVQIAMQALRQANEAACASNGSGPDSYEFVLSCSPQSDVARVLELFVEYGPWPYPIKYIVDQGSNFDEHFNDAYHQLFAQGYKSVVCVGGDLPLMRPDHITRAFEWLNYLEQLYGRGGLVMAPCQECGVSLVGLSATADMDFRGVFYNPTGISALDAIVNVAAENEVPAALLDAIPDVDNAADLAHAISVARAMAYCAAADPAIQPPLRFLDWVQQAGIVVSTPPNTQYDPREQLDA